MIDVNKYCATPAEIDALAVEFDLAEKRYKAALNRKEAIERMAETCRRGGVTDEMLAAALDVAFGKAPATPAKQEVKTEATEPKRTRKPSDKPRKARADANEMADRKQAILSAMHCGATTVKAISEASGVEYQQTQFMLRKLRESGCVESDPWRVL